MLRGIPFEGLLDTGADVSIIRQADWPKDWPLWQSSQTLHGLGIADQPQQSASIIPWTDREGHKGSFQPYVCTVPVTLWGREVLSVMGLHLSNEFYQAGSQQAWNIMENMGYSGKGLGKSEQGRIEPIPIKQHPERTGLGFQPGPLRNDNDSH
ncbi:endogenous retrovirus group K member 7 Pro protein-like [Ochotona princeps]|uniref:endogenous retrovirus group K member 7 Pro protein-like n=1 Tax=Ochotona princeps TaxID=9978 RepID=UPI0027147F21|nr:endogenous retrovirus group K member 7 Pro protein-like [Ochotona princeps]